MAHNWLEQAEALSAAAVTAHRDGNPLAAALAVEMAQEQALNLGYTPPDDLIDRLTLLGNALELHHDAAQFFHFETRRRAYPKFLPRDDGPAATDRFRQDCRTRDSFDAARAALNTANPLAAAAAFLDSATQTAERLHDPLAGEIWEASVIGFAACLHGTSFWKSDAPTGVLARIAADGGLEAGRFADDLLGNHGAGNTGRPALHLLAWTAPLARALHDAVDRRAAFDVIDARSGHDGGVTYMTGPQGRAALRGLVGAVEEADRTGNVRVAEEIRRRLLQCRDELARSAQQPGIASGERDAVDRLVVSVAAAESGRGALRPARIRSVSRAESEIDALLAGGAGALLSGPLLGAAIAFDRAAALAERFAPGRPAFEARQEIAGFGRICATADDVADARFIIAGLNVLADLAGEPMRGLARRMADAATPEARAAVRNDVAGFIRAMAVPQRGL